MNTVSDYNFAERVQIPGQPIADFTRAADPPNILDRLAGDPP